MVARMTRKWSFMKITKHAQSCIILESNGSRIIIDPGKFIDEKEKLDTTKLGDFDAILITHEHSDHLSVEIIQNLLANNKKGEIQIIVNPASRSILEEVGISDIKTAVAGQEVEIGTFKIISTVSKHGPLPSGNEPPEVFGYIISDGNFAVYAPGDTIEIPENLKADIVLLPICGKVTMNEEEAAEASKILKPKIAIPIHMDNPIFPADADKFASLLKDTDIEVKILKNGEEIEV